MSPEDRHRHEPPRVPPRSARSHDAAHRGQRDPGDRRRLHPLRHRRRARRSAVRRAADALRAGAADARRPRHPPPRDAHGQQRGDAARRAGVVRLRPARPAALWPGAAAAGDDARPRAGHEPGQHGGVGEGRAPGRGRQLRDALPHRRAAADRRGAGRLRRRHRHPQRQPRRRPGPRPARPDRRRRLHGHDDDRRHRRRRRAGRRGRHRRPAGRRAARHARDRGDHRRDSLGAALPDRLAHRARVCRSGGGSRRE